MYKSPNRAHEDNFYVILMLNYLFESGSWRLHLWGHFCLCYDGQKLVTETDSIRNYGIKDGDQVSGGFPLSY